MTAPTFKAVTAPPSILQDLNALQVPRLSEDGLALLKPDGTVLAMQCAPVVFDPPAGAYAVSQDVTLTTASAACDIYYTTDGTDPDPTSTKYTVPIATGATGTVTLRAIAVRAGYVQSVIGEADYVLPVTWDAIASNANLAFTNGDLTATANALGSYYTGRATTARSTGKYIFGIRLDVDGGNSDIVVGLMDATVDVNSNAFIDTATTHEASINDYGYGGYNNIFQDPLAGTWPIGNGGFMYVAYDADAGKVWIGNSIDGWIGDPSAGTDEAFAVIPNTAFYPGIALFGGAPAASITANFGASAFDIAMPTGFSAWQS